MTDQDKCRAKTVIGEINVRDQVDPDEFDALLRIVNALCITLTRHFPNDHTIQIIAEGANNLYAKKRGKNDRPR